MAKLVFRLHALQRMFARNISENEVHSVIEKGETIENYDNDTPYPSKLILGINRDRFFHIVAAFNELENEVIIITVYEPDPHLWDNSFKARRKK